MTIKNNSLMILPPHNPESWDDSLLSEYRSEVGARSEVAIIAGIFSLPIGIFTAFTSLASSNFHSLNLAANGGLAVTALGLISSALAYTYSRHMNTIDDIQMVRTKLFFSAVRRMRPYDQFAKPYAVTR
jgi:hypothetical protein